ncbi:LysM domain-containing protein [Phenylobacterium sp.]|jgi:hypothetical protein|uniref:LysM peptidoglycan-binding domain-containing protein n=1 Tax=Phenylobacterium sp. TaxID=1871053 RepID=UPI002E2F5B4C|nr:LysM domain-containing protein [Phenylobacterium sp.]HEX2559633.1 LysM domain-containing protein [Phenylobacterium sp.]
MKLRALLLSALAAGSLAACAQTPKDSPIAVAAPTAQAVPGTPAERERAALDLMNQGRVEEARKVLDAMLADDADNAVARRLIVQLDADPKALITGKAQPYTVGPGETLSMLAGRFLGDPLLFYALAKYNGFAAPSHVQPGHVIQVPRKVRPAMVSAKPKAGSGPRTAKAVAPEAPAAGPKRDTALAAQLRASGLQQLNSGSPARAVTLLQQALAADPGNPTIQRDLARAQRIQASLSR